MVVLADNKPNGHKCHWNSIIKQHVKGIPLQLAWPLGLYTKKVWHVLLWYGMLLRQFVLRQLLLRCIYGATFATAYKSLNMAWPTAINQVHNCKRNYETPPMTDVNASHLSFWLRDNDKELLGAMRFYLIKTYMHRETITRHSILPHCAVRLGYSNCEHGLLSIADYGLNLIFTIDDFNTNI